MGKPCVLHEDTFYEYFKPFRHADARHDIWGGHGLETFGKSSMRFAVKIPLLCGLASMAILAPINVVKTAQSRGDWPPAHFDKLTAIYYHEDDKTLADWIARQAAAGENQNVDLRDLSKRFPNIRKGLVELWLP